MQIETGKSRSSFRQIAIFCASTCLVGGLLFYPVYSSYGIEFLDYYNVVFPTSEKIIWRLTNQVYGLGGLIAIGLGIIVSIILGFFGWKQTVFREKLEKKLIISWLLVIVLYTIAFFTYPIKTAFLIPIIPFVLLLIAHFIERRVFYVLCVLIIISSFINLYPGKHVGPIFQQRAMRIMLLEESMDIISELKKIYEKSVIVLGWKLPFVSNLYKKPPHMDFTYLLKPEALKKYVEEEYRIYYLPQIRKTNLETHGVDLKEYGAMPIPSRKSSPAAANTLPGRKP